ncbi:hypothetical protein BDFB_011744 [Asbolus verrucosus]|uniref:Uncharacterized protein n=1 Tax=Asbolus verrucosus TaxID=1661398 RepID=A0A482V9D5_ASBVE|nr:hypothetical protein BDFB_011744 [Asbolus verrucosus]
MLFENGKFRQTLDLCVSNFREIRSVTRKKGSGGPKKKNP